MLTPVRTAIVGAVVAALVTLPGLGTGTLWDNSETAYGEVAREILLTHDWVVMHLNATPWFVQPPLYFWIAAILGKALGVAPFALRLPSALATIAMGAGLGYASSRLAGARTGILGALILSTSLMQAIVGRLAIMDALLDLAIGLGILASFRAFTGGRPRAAIIGACLALAFGVLAKGPVAVVIPVLVIGPWLVWERRAGAVLVRQPAVPWVLGVALGALVVVPWFAWLYAREGAHAVAELFGHYTVGRYLGTIENQTGPLWYYLPVVILGFFPWIAFLPAAFAAAWRAAQAPSAHLERLAIVWAVVPFAFFSFAQTKLPNYVALELPALALLVALWFDRLAAGAPRRAAIVSAAVVPLTVGGLAFAIWAFSRDAHLAAALHGVFPDLIAMGAIFLAGSAITLALLMRTAGVALAPYALGATALIAISYIALIAEPHAERYKPIPPLAQVIEAQRRAGDAIAIQGVAGGNGLVFYTTPHVFTLDPPNETPLDERFDPRRLICGAPRTFVVTSRKRPTPDPQYGRRRRILASAANDVLFLYDGAPCVAATASLR